jgi:alkanesulfonate monooxygenase SsuD/methylene tetrahydromethanopterin reductase-like flavin-dependent oxidoreductase (luciferase family)
VRGLVDGERVTLDGRFWSAEDLVLLPPPARRIPLMIGSNGPRMLSIALPHVDWWNTWFEQFGNRADGFATLNTRIDDACERAGRDPNDVRRSACLLVAVDGGAGERRAQPAAPPLSSDELPAELEALAQAGADEAILVLDPITEPALRSLRTVLPSG